MNTNPVGCDHVNAFSASLCVGGQARKACRKEEESAIADAVLVVVAVIESKNLPPQAPAQVEASQRAASLSKTAFARSSHVPWPGLL